MSASWTKRGNIGQQRSDLSSTNTSTTSKSKVDLVMMWVDFLENICELQVLDLHSLNESERAAFFLNLYHIMVIHGSLVLFPPQTSSNWHPFFHDVAYLVGFNVMSIADI